VLVVFSALTFVHVDIAANFRRRAVEVEIVPIGAGTART
jgi:hypothetical protein